MSEPARSSRTSHRLPMTWRIPPWQAAALILVASALIAFAMYGNPSPGALIMALFVAAVALVGATLAMRFLLVADDEGIWVRRVFSEQVVDWRDVAEVEMAILHRNTMTVRITRANGTWVDVPPSLVQPTLPTGIRRARAMVGASARQLMAIATEHRADK